jgi:hypothetical protein
MSEQQSNAQPIDKLVKVYIKMRAKRDELKKEYEDKLEDIEAQMTKVKHGLLEYCKETNVDSVRTPEGLFYRTVKRKFTTNDWESLHGFILEHQVPQLLAKSIHQSNMEQFLEENPDLLPPGLSVDSEYVITIRRK